MLGLAARSAEAEQLGRYFGRRRYLIACTALFTFASALCGLADSLAMLIVARVLQGIGGGALQPVSQAIMLETFPAEKRGISMSVYSIGVVVAPILGPTLFGWLTDNYSWRWVFHINLPVGIFAVAMCLLFLEDPPYLKTTNTRRIDYIGFGLLVIWIGCLQILLDKGQDEDWFSSIFIRWLAAGASAGLIIFLVWELRVKDPIINLRILSDRNLAIAVFQMFVVGAILFGNLNLEIAPANVIWPIVISGFAIPLIFVPMTTFSVATVPKEGMGDATGITSLVRNLGGSVGISLITTFIARGTQAHQALLVSHLTPHSRLYLERVNQIGAILASQSGQVTAHAQTYHLLYQTLQQQAALWAYIDQFWLLAIVSLLVAPIVFLYRRPTSLHR